MNDDDMMAAMRSTLVTAKESLTDVHLDRSPALITARARARRMRRGLSGAVAVGTALGVGLAVGLSGGHAAARSVHVNLAAWSVNTTPGGLVNLTVRELRDPGLLRQVLADAGVPAMVTFGRVCTATSGDLQQLGHVVQKSRDIGGTVIIIDPAAMPAGSELIIGFAQQAAKNGTAPPAMAAGFGLINDGAALSCHAPGSPR